MKQTENMKTKQYEITQYITAAVT